MFIHLKVFLIVNLSIRRLSKTILINYANIYLILLINDIKTYQEIFPVSELYHISKRKASQKSISLLKKMSRKLKLLARLLV